MRSLHVVAFTMPGLGSLALGCAPPSTVADLGPAPTLGPGVQVRQEWRQPPTITVDLSQPAFVTLFVVAPNHSADLLTLVTPDSFFASGTHVLRLAAGEAPRSGPPIAGGAYPDLGAACAVPDFVQQTTRISVGLGGEEQKTDVITFATPSTSPPIVTCSVPGLSRPAPMPGAVFDRYLLAVATDKPVVRDAVGSALARLDVSGTPREVSERVAALAAREAKAVHWGARAIRF